jgi:hypothetical protein
VKENHFFLDDFFSFSGGLSGFSSTTSGAAGSSIYRPISVPLLLIAVFNCVKMPKVASTTDFLKAGGSLRD